MLVKAKLLRHYKLVGTDSEVGRIDEFYFDDRHWTIRYVVADTGKWLKGRQVLLSPYALTDMISGMHEVGVNLTKEQIEKSPPIKTDEPVSRQFEESYYGFYGWPMYWAGAYLWGQYPDIVKDPSKWTNVTSHKSTWNSHLRSTREVRGYSVHALDGEAGHIDDFVIDLDTWNIKSLIIDTGSWWSGDKVFIPPSVIQNVRWGDKRVDVNLTREELKRLVIFPAIRQLNANEL